MAVGLPTADDVLAAVNALISEMGADAFRTDGRVQLYSGPRRAIRLALPWVRNNHVRAIPQARRSHLTMIEHTSVAQYLGGLDTSGSIYLYFAKKYARRYGADSEEAFLEADKVMRETSREFIKAAFGHVASAVCGSATNRIFFAVELPAMIENGRIETINGLPAAMVREFYNLDPYEAFRLICVAELLEARRYARAVKPSRLKRQANRDYRERLSFFVRERQATTRRVAAVPAEEVAHLKLAKQQILARYRIMEDMAAILDAEPMPPPAAMPIRRVYAVSPHGVA